MKLIDKDTVKYIAGLSRLSLDEKELALYAGQLADILLYISKLNQLNTEGVPPTSHVLSTLVNVERPDAPGKSLEPDEAVANAPDKADGFFRIPKVIEGK